MHTPELVSMGIHCAISIAFAVLCIALARRVGVLGSVGLVLAVLLDLAQAIGFAVARHAGESSGYDAWFELRRTTHIVSIACNLVTAALFFGSLLLIRFAHKPASTEVD